jgi:hypothetical protein
MSGVDDGRDGLYLIKYETSSLAALAAPSGRVDGSHPDTLGGSRLGPDPLDCRCTDQPSVVASQPEPQSPMGHDLCGGPILAPRRRAE